MVQAPPFLPGQLLLGGAGLVSLFFFSYFAGFWVHRRLSGSQLVGGLVSVDISLNDKVFSNVPRCMPHVANTLDEHLRMVRFKTGWWSVLGPT